MLVYVTMIDLLRLLGGRQGTFISIIMIDRLRLLGGYQSIFIIVIDIDIELFPHIECSFIDSDGINNCCFLFNTSLLECE